MSKCRLRAVLDLIGEGSVVDFVPLEKAFSLATVLCVDLDDVAQSMCHSNEFCAKFELFLKNVLHFGDQFKVKEIIFFLGSSESIEDTPLALEVLRQIEPLIENRLTCKLYCSPGRALGAAVKYLSSNSQNHRFILCSNSIWAFFLYGCFSCTISPEELCGNSTSYSLKCIASSRLSSKLGLDDPQLLQIFAVLVKHVDTDPGLAIEDFVSLLVKGINSWNGLLCGELLREIGCTEVGGCKMMEMTFDLGELVGDSSFSPICIDKQTPAVSLPFLLRCRYSGVVRMNNKPIHDIFRPVRHAILFSIIPGGLVKEAYGDTYEVMRIEANNSKLSDAFQKGFLSSLRELLAMNSVGDNVFTLSAVLLDEIIRKLPPYFQLVATALLLLNRVGQMTDSMCQCFARVLLGAHWKRAEKTEDLIYALAAFKICLMYVSLANAVLQIPGDLKCLPTSPLVYMSSLLTIDDFLSKSDNQSNELGADMQSGGRDDTLRVFDTILSQK